MYVKRRVNRSDDCCETYTIYTRKECKNNDVWMVCET